MNTQSAVGGEQLVTVTIPTPAEIDDMAFAYCPSGKIGELREFAAILILRMQNK